ncbi:ricin-type beta-trefoil lectin domain protein [Streptomyces griseorubiginosus]|uniref:ricin-type beta-trefoil lectin domain protein n=1 Tax=Streptomyces griseorubiginosus TaxID=67304 RepID=UPI00114016C6|nr:ricin-type beta-trefoil lectin domain protein [Streptomyces griseorubiginosus]
MKDAGLSNSPSPVRPYDVTDEQLSAELKKWSGTTPALQPVGELLDRHWEAAFAYARLCTDGPRPAGMLTTAAFTRLFGESLRQTGPSAAWRPHLLVTVRRIAAEWDSDGRREMLNPALRSEEDGELVAARLLPPDDRRLLSGAFQRLQQSARCLLWHTEVEAEPIGVPAALLGLDEEAAGIELRRARDRLREECLQVHRELAPEQECRHYLRLLDVTYRRGGVDLDPDLRAHLEQCRHCMHTADQLHQFNGGLGLALAEAVLGWGAGAYVTSRMSVDDTGAAQEARRHAPARPFVAEAFGTTLPPTAPPVGTDSGDSAVPGPRSRARAASRRSAHRGAARRTSRRNLTAAVLTVSGLIVLPLVMWSALGSSDGDHASAAGPSEAPGSDTASSTGDPSQAGAGEARKGDLRGRLHNVESGLCVGVVGKEIAQGVETGLAECSGAEGQQWTYETDGLLRSAADPQLCLDSRLGYSVRLALCTGETSPGGKDIRYDFTLQGTLVPRWNQDLALTPAATDGSGALVLKNRDEDSAQRWVFDTSKTEPQMQAVNWDAEGSPTPTPKSAPAPSKTPTATPTPTSAPTTPQTTPTPSSSAPPGQDCSSNPYACSWGGPPGGGYGGGYGGGGYGGGYGGRR